MTSRVILGKDGALLKDLLAKMGFSVSLLKVNMSTNAVEHAHSAVLHHATLPLPAIVVDTFKPTSTVLILIIKTRHSYLRKISLAASKTAMEEFCTDADGVFHYLNIFSSCSRF